MIRAINEKCANLRYGAWNDFFYTLAPKKIQLIPRATRAFQIRPNFFSFQTTKKKHRTLRITPPTEAQRAQKKQQKQRHKGTKQRNSPRAPEIFAPQHRALPSGVPFLLT